MKAETWLVRCAAELQHLYLLGRRGREGDVPLDDWGLATAGELIAGPRYRGLDPVQAARMFYRLEHFPGRPRPGSPSCPPGALTAR